MFVKQDSMIGKELGFLYYYIFLGKYKVGGALEVVFFGNSLVFKVDFEINIIIEISYRILWQYIIEIQERIKVFVILVVGNKLKEFREL